jgi:predicted  nucleic acid-binding Zn-ribbon protein
MPDCERNDQRLKSLEKRMEKTENKVDEMGERIPVLSTLMERMIISNEKQTEIIDDMKCTLIKVNENLSNLNTEIKDTNNRVGELEIKINKNEDLYKIDTRKLQKKQYINIFESIIGVGTLTGIGLLLLKIFGII